MTYVTNAKYETRALRSAHTTAPKFFVTETYWGYIIGPKTGPDLATQAKQAIAMLSGATLAASALGLVILPDFMAGSTDFLLRYGAAVAFAALSIYLMRIAIRGTQVELQVDTSQGEIRESVRNRGGRSTRLGTYGFDAIGSVFIDRTDPNPLKAVLMLRFGNTNKTTPVAEGTVQQLEALKDRLGQDLIIGQQ